MTEKVCSRCGVVYPLDTEHFNWRRKAAGQFQPVCKECQREQKREWYEKNAHHVKEYNAKYRTENAKVYAEYNRKNAKRSGYIARCTEKKPVRITNAEWKPMNYIG